MPATVPSTDRAVAAAMITSPKTLPATTTVAQVREAFQDDHVHCVLILDGAVLLTVLERPDMVEADPKQPAASLGRLRGRSIGPHEDLEPVRLAMLSQRRRRLAVVDSNQTLLGLLCLKRTGLGFCSDADVGARAAERGILASAAGNTL